jgi:hypothetical protein
MRSRPNVQPWGSSVAGSSRWNRSSVQPASRRRSTSIVASSRTSSRRTTDRCRSGSHCTSIRTRPAVMAGAPSVTAASSPPACTTTFRKVNTASIGAKLTSVTSTRVPRTRERLRWASGTRTIARPTRTATTMASSQNHFRQRERRRDTRTGPLSDARSGTTSGTYSVAAGDATVQGILAAARLQTREKIRTRPPDPGQPGRARRRRRPALYPLMACALSCLTGRPHGS